MPLRLSSPVRSSSTEARSARSIVRKSRSSPLRRIELMASARITELNTLRTQCSGWGRSIAATATAQQAVITAIVPRSHRTSRMTAPVPTTISITLLVSQTSSPR